jgi:transketolase
MPTTTDQVLDTRELAQRIRIHALRMTSRGGSSHIGAALSCADILAVLYGEVLRVDPANPKWAGRDRFVLSKGHAGCAVYAALAERGFFPPEYLRDHYQNGSKLSGHISHKGIPGVELSTGALGHGLAVTTGMAFAGHLDGAGWRAVALLGDGECDEGSVWEAALFAGHHGLENLTLVVDYNKIQSLGPVAETVALEPFADKWSCFGWAVREVDGHDHDALKQALGSLPIQAGKPSCIIAHTVKGKGVSFMENTVLWHYRTARGEEFDTALAELEAV